MKRSAPWEEAHAISSDSDSEEDVLKLKKLSEGELINNKAETYQEFMELIKIPANRGSQIPFTSWQGLGQSVKQLYGQPLHYLTNILLKQWDLSRVGSPDEHRPLDSLVHPLKAEALIWVTEETHRRTASHHYVAKLWASDPLYHANIDGIFPAKEDIQPNLFP